MNVAQSHNTSQLSGLVGKAGSNSANNNMSNSSRNYIN